MGIVYSTNKHHQASTTGKRAKLEKRPTYLFMSHHILWSYQAGRKHKRTLLSYNKTRQRENEAQKNGRKEYSTKSVGVLESGNVVSRDWDRIICIFAA